MIAILGGLGAAVAWAMSTLCSSRSSRLIEPTAVVAWVMLTGLMITVPVAAASGVPGSLNATSGAWLVISGAGNVGGLLLAYGAMRIAKVALVAPLVSTEGAITALIALAVGETVAPAVGLTLAVIVVGICLAAVPTQEQSLAPEAAAAGSSPGLRSIDAPPSREGHSAGERSDRARHLEAVALALSASVVFGACLYATARAGSLLPASWVVLSARAIGTVGLALPLALTGRLRLAPQVVPLVVVAGVCEVLGFYAFTLGSRHGIAVAAVLASQFAALAALAGYALFGERLSRIQVIGVCTVVAGVALLSALRA